MQGKYIVPDIQSALSKALHPTTVLWNRLEGRPRKAEFSRALKAEVRDALWMLSRQWQLGEFQGDDAGSPVKVKLSTELGRLDRFQVSGKPVEALPTEVPLETRVEQMPLLWEWAGKRMRLDLRLQVAQYWQKLLTADGLAAYKADYLAKFPISLPAEDRDNAYLYAHKQVHQQFAAVAGRSMDGGLFLADLESNPASTGIVVSNPAHVAQLDALGAELKAWFAQMYMQPGEDGPNAWIPEKLEYQFKVAGTIDNKEKVLDAEEYYHGHLDWHAFDFDNAAAGMGSTQQAPTSYVNTMIPAPIEFDGMPDTRWWSLEDRKTNFGEIKPAKTDLAQMLLMEFALVYANDWFVIPMTLPVGSLAKVRGMVVTNVFGENTWIEAAGKGSDQNWQRWAMYNLNIKGDANIPADLTLVLAPGTANMQEGYAEEEVMLVRDEMANMVWGIEQTILHADGHSAAGKAAALDTVKYHVKQIGAGADAALPFEAPIYYKAMTTVPEHWIPFVPVHVPGSNREVQLQRGRMLRVISRDPEVPKSIEPRSILLREGLDQDIAAAYFIHEEEVPRSGVVVTRAFQRTRWVDGQAPVWLGVRKQTGRGERGSGLAFDKIANSPPDQIS